MLNDLGKRLRLATEPAKPDAACSDEILKWNAMSAPLPGAQHTTPPFVSSVMLFLGITVILAPAATCSHEAALRCWQYCSIQQL